MALLRTLLFVPGGRESMLAKAPTLAADAIILDLEDSVPLGEKEGARALVREAIPSVGRSGREVWVRVNSTYTGLAKDDCRAVVSAGLSGILLPKANSPEIVRFAEALLRDAEALNGVESGRIRLIAGIESAAAVLHAEAISHGSERLIGLAFGSEDYTADMQVERTHSGQELAFARGMIATAARAAGLIPIDTVYPYLHDNEGLVREALDAKRAGFKGKLLIHPDQIDPVARVFTPSEEEIPAARRIVDGYQRAIEQGRGAVQVDGIMVDAPVARRAENLLKLFDAPR